MSRTDPLWLLVALASLVGHAPTVAAAGATPPPLDQHLGVASCASTTCHGRAKPATSGNIQQNEYLIWARYDPHAGARALLFEERSRTMAKRLGLKAAHEAPECLACHAEQVPASRQGPKFQVSDGIGCEACHGAAERWLATHYAPDATHAGNVARGLVSLPDPAVRAGTCLGCHVGDADDRFATHRIMAAGHPRLPFELDTWSELWRTSGGRAHYLRDADYATRKPLPDILTMWTTGLVAQGQGLAAMLAGRYRTDRGLPDFSLFNCYSCHRDMRLAAWREKGRDAGGDPGQLRFDDSALTLLATALASRPELQRRLRGDTLALQRTAGLDAPTVTRAARVLAATLADIGTALAERPLGKPEAAAALAALGRSASRGEYPDYAGAEQAAMGLLVLASTVGNCGPDSAAVRAVFASVASDAGYRADRLGVAAGTLATLCAAPATARRQAY